VKSNQFITVPCASLHIISEQAGLVFYTPRFNNQACLHWTKEKENQLEELVPEETSDAKSILSSINQFVDLMIAIAYIQQHNNWTLYLSLKYKSLISASYIQ
jgi:hypothetical protein